MSDRATNAPSFSQTRKNYTWLFAAIGTVTSASAVVSLIQHGFDIHLNWGFSHFVQFYRDTFAPVLDLALWPVQTALAAINISLPQWTKDLWALSFLGCGIFLRALLMYVDTLKLAAASSVDAWTWRIFQLQLTLLTVWIGISGIGLILWIAPWDIVRYTLPWAGKPPLIKHLEASRLSKLGVEPEHLDDLSHEAWPRTIEARQLRKTLEGKLSSAIAGLSALSVVAVIAFYVLNSAVAQLYE